MLYQEEIIQLIFKMLHFSNLEPLKMILGAGILLKGKKSLSSNRDNLMEGFQGYAVLAMEVHAFESFFYSLPGNCDDHTEWVKMDVSEPKLWEFIAAQLPNGSLTTTVMTPLPAGEMSEGAGSGAGRFHAQSRFLVVRCSSPHSSR